MAQTAKNQPSREYVAALKKMITVASSDATFKVMILRMFGMMRQQLPNVPAELWDGIEKEMMKTLVDDLVEMLVPVYIKHLSLTGLQEISKFYESSASKKMAVAQPVMIKDSRQAGQQWGMRAVMKVQEALKAKGYMQ